MLYGTLTSRWDIRAMQGVRTFAYLRNFDVNPINGFLVLIQS